jgi:uncharacterized protein affecting Mg2+/Co2+ transport
MTLTSLTYMLFHMQVEASPLYIPERSGLNEPLFSYQISMRLLGETADYGMKQCQLSRRHWRIEDEYVATY